MKNMWGTTSEKEDPRAGTLVCSADDVSGLSAIAYPHLVNTFLALQQHRCREHHYLSS